MESAKKAVVIVLCEPARTASHGEKTRDAVRRWLEESGFSAAQVEVLDFDAAQLRRNLEAVPADARLIVICGGTGIGSRDIVPQTLRALCDFEVPGIGEMLRSGSLKFSLNAALSRCGAYVWRERLMVSVPGSAKAALEQLDILKELLPHAVESVAGKCTDRRPPR